MSESRFIPLAPGSRLGPYAISAAIGVGGMGEVYRGRDTKLNRDVAIKVLPPAFARDAERMARFQREAQTLAALNHPNIAQIFGLEEGGEGAALVMEFVPGETLRGPLPVEEAVIIARQVAQALEYAHEKGIIHRDLKPANIKITPEGQVKVLDFGLAKAMAPAGNEETADQNYANSPTLSVAATKMGMILGTAGYMSPEQAKGKLADRRSDIWSFGIVLLELLTGKPAYTGETASEVMAAVMLQEPAWPQDLPPALDNLLRRCLTKDTRQRLQSIGEARIILEQPLSKSEPAAVKQSVNRMPYLLAIAALALLALGLALRQFVFPPVPPAQAVAHLLLTLTPAGGIQSGFAFSPDGRSLIFSGRGEQRVSTAQIYVRPLDQPRALPLAGTQGGQNPFVSPDGKWIGFEAEGKLKTIPVDGGAVTVLSDSFRLGASWGPGDWIIFPHQVRLARISTKGGTPQPVSDNEAGPNDAYQGRPHVLPGGRAVLYTAQSETGPQAQPSLAVLSLETKERRVLIPDAGFGHYASTGRGTGHLVFLRGRNLMAVRFDVSRLAVIGEPVRLLEGMDSTEDFALSADGSSLAYLPPNPIGNTTTTVWVDRSGKTLSMSAPARDYSDPRLSRDGRKLAVVAGNDIWTYDIARTTLTRFTFDPGEDETPVWSPDGKWLAYSSSRVGQPRKVIRRASDGTGSEEFLWSNQHHSHVESWSRDGRYLLLADRDPETSDDIWVIDLQDKPAARPLLKTRFRETEARISPDGKWLAYTSDESGNSEVFVQPFPSMSGKWQVSSSGGTQPIWSADGRELFYRGDGKMMAVRVAPGAAFQAAQPTALFADRFVSPDDAVHTWYDVSPDGKRFVMLQGPETSGPQVSYLNVIVNFAEELRRRVQ